MSESQYRCVCQCVCVCDSMYVCVCVCVEKLFIKLFNNIEHVMTLSDGEGLCQVYFIFYGCCDCQKEKPFNELFNFLTSKSML